MRIQRFGHAGIEVGDLAVAERFYRDVLGFEVKARFQDDGEIMFAVGRDDHLLLHSPAADRNSAPGAAAAGLNHAAFELVEGHRQMAAVQRRLAEIGVAFDSVDHGGDASVYFRDPDGNLLEVYAAAGSTPHFESPEQRLAGARHFLYAIARSVDRAVFEHVFEGAPAQRVLWALDAYRNPDGGFGHALEPDVRAPGSQPIQTLTALEMLHQAGIRAPELADACCSFLSSVATPDAAVPALLPGALEYPAAAHWQGPFALRPSLGWTFGLAAELAWHGARHGWLDHATRACLAAVDGELGAEAHQLLYLMRFAGVALSGEQRDRLLARCREALSSAELFAAETPVEGYGLTPLHFAPAPDVPARGCFDDALITAHLDDLVDAQQGDGGWPIRFEPPSDAASLEWRGRWTLEALSALRAYGRL